MSTTAPESVHSVIDSGLVRDMAQALYATNDPEGVLMDQNEYVQADYLEWARAACAYATRYRTAFYATTVGPDDENFA